MKVYHVHGIRHNAVIFAETQEEAIAQAAEQGLVGDWESPEAPHTFHWCSDKWSDPVQV